MVQSTIMPATEADMNASEILKLAKAVFIELRFGENTITYLNTSGEVPTYRLVRKGNGRSEMVPISVETALRALTHWKGSIHFRFRLGASAHTPWERVESTDKLKKAVVEYLWPGFHSVELLRRPRPTLTEVRRAAA